MNYELEARQCIREGKLYVRGTVMTPTIGYVVDTLSMTLSTNGDAGELYMDLMPPASGGLRAMGTDADHSLDIQVCRDASAFIRMLTIHMNGQTITLPVKQIREPNPTD